MGQHQALPEGQPKGACIDLVELGLCRFCSGIQSLKKGGCVSPHKGLRDLDRLGL